MNLAEKFTCDIPIEGRVFLECSLPSAGAIEWFGAIVGALSLLVAAGAAWVSIRFANREHQRANKADKRSLRERLGNQAVQAFADFARDPLSGDFELFEGLNSRMLPYRENLDQDDVREKQLYEDLMEAFRSAAIMHTYAIYHTAIINEPISADRQIRLKGLAGELSREVQMVVHGLAYTQNVVRINEAYSRFTEKVAKILDETKTHATVKEEV